MSIATKAGDSGETRLMYGRKVPKSHPRVEAYGAVDELNAALGVARASVGGESIQEPIIQVQKDLICLMGELATQPEDIERYQRDGFPRITRDATQRLDAWVQEIEAQEITFRGWATPGRTQGAASLDVARTVCRRAERRVSTLHEHEALANPEILVFLNRLSDLLWLWARWVEHQVGSD